MLQINLYISRKDQIKSSEECNKRWRSCYRKGTISVSRSIITTDSTSKENKYLNYIHQSTKTKLT